MYLVILQRLALEAILDLVYFPLWWYSGGAKHSLFRMADRMKSGSERLAPGIWFKNLFVPMFGQYDWEGRIISFVMRSFQVIVRTIALMVWFVICLIFFVLYLLFPAAVLYGLGWSIVRL